MADDGLEREQREQLTIESDGWIAWTLPSFHEVDIKVSLEGGRYVVTGLRISADPGRSIAAADLRAVPLGRFEQIVNGPEVRRLLEATGERRRVPVLLAVTPDLEDDAAEVTSEVLADVLHVEVPAGRGRPDSFYVAVAEAFAKASQIVRAPAKRMAEANDVPVTTVHAWLKEAKRRGVMAPDRRGLRHEA